MADDALVRLLSELTQLDIDAVHVYDQAIKALDDKIIKERITRFRDNHEQHAVLLMNEIRAMGAEPPKYTRDIKGYVMEAVTAVRTVSGMEGALKALKTTEERTNRYYGEAVSLEVPSGIKEILRKHFSDEKIHLDYITSNL